MALTVQCEACGKSFTTCPSRLERGYGRFCSKSCSPSPARNHPWRNAGAISNKQVSNKETA